MGCVPYGGKAAPFSQAFGWRYPIPRKRGADSRVAVFNRSMLSQQAFVLPFQGIVMPGMGGGG
jgi:hypothetical protein